MKQPLVWIDLEMTGLDPETDRILELAVIVTDGSLEELHEGPQLVLRADPTALERMIPLVREMHTRSGLLDAAQASSVTAAQAEAVALQFVRAHVPDPRSAPLAGNSVHADRAFLARYMPRLEAHLHYRNVDVSTVKELARRWNPAALEQAPDKAGSHRALDDLHESIAELRYYRQAFFTIADEAAGDGTAQSPQ